MSKRRSWKKRKRRFLSFSAGSELKLVLGGYIQANFEGGDVSAFEGRFGQTAIDDRFRLRRARINLTGEFAEQFDFKIEGEFGQSDGISSNRTAFSGTDIFVNWHQFPEAQIKVGQWKAPFGLEQLTPDPSLIIIERSLPTGAITPERQIGVQLWGKPFTNVWPEQKDLLTYYAGIFNGNGRNTTINDNNAFMYVGRLELHAVQRQNLRSRFQSEAWCGRPKQPRRCGHEYLAIVEPIGKRRRFALALRPVDTGRADGVERGCLVQPRSV